LFFVDPAMSAAGKFGHPLGPRRQRMTQCRKSSGLNCCSTTGGVPTPFEHFHPQTTLSKTW
jgi:hypothetical protein